MALWLAYPLLMDPNATAWLLREGKVAGIVALIVWHGAVAACLLHSPSAPLRLRDVPVWSAVALLSFAMAWIASWPVFYALGGSDL